MARHLLVTNDHLPKTGGIQVYLHELWRRLDDGRATILTASSHPDATTFDRDSEVVIERISSSTLFLPTRRIRREIEAAIARHDPDLVLLDPAWPLGLVGPRLSRPYGVIAHGAEVTIPGHLPLVASTLRYVVRHAAVVICAGAYPEAQVRRVSAKETPTVLQVPPGVDLDRFRPLPASERDAVRSRLGLRPDAWLLSSYSRLVPRKGMDTLIRAAAELRTVVPNLQVAIGGSGRDRARLEKLVARTGAPVVFLGRVPDEDLAPWLGASEVMVMNCRSRWLGLEQEGFGMVFVEAAACGVPQIAGRSGGSHEAVTHDVTGLIVRHPRRVRELVAAIRELYFDEDKRARLAAASRPTAERRFNWDTLSGQLARGLAPFDHGAATLEE